MSCFPEDPVFSVRKTSQAQKFVQDTDFRQTAMSELADTNAEYEVSSRAGDFG